MHYRPRNCKFSEEFLRQLMGNARNMGEGKLSILLACFEAMGVPMHNDVTGYSVLSAMFESPEFWIENARRQLDTVRSTLGLEFNNTEMLKQITAAIKAVTDSDALQVIVDERIEAVAPLDFRVVAYNDLHHGYQTFNVFEPESIQIFYRPATVGLAAQGVEHAVITYKDETAAVQIIEGYKITVNLPPRQ